ncbi:stress response translation initiation inhibitor YciH [archaeon]|nr:MAG: stress response translation initiation inhibitor YciH [archaeon]
MVEEICPVCGLPKPSLCVCSRIEKSEQKIRVFVEKRKFNKPTTVVEGITERGKEVSKQLKSKLACGGTFKDNHIELMGNHKDRVKAILVGMGYSDSQIEVS